MTVDQIVSAIRALPVAERLRVIEIVAHEAAGDVSVANAGQSGVALIERNGLLFVSTDAALSEEVFDHHRDRDARAAHIWRGA